MPKTSVDEDSDPRGPKHNVSPTIEPCQWSRINSVAQTHVMKFATKSHLRRGVRTPISKHHVS